MKKYFAYLLRIWSNDEPDHPVWSASLEDPHTRKLIQFAQLSELIAYLLSLTEPSSPRNFNLPHRSQTDHEN